MHPINVAEQFYQTNLQMIWESLLPSQDTIIIKDDGSFEKINLTVREVFQHYCLNFIQFTVALPLLPITWSLCMISSLLGRVTPEKTPCYQQPDEQFPLAYGFANSGFQDGGIGTDFDPSSLKGQGINDWDKILNRSPQIVTKDGKKIGETTGGITLQEGEEIKNLFVNIMDYPKEFAALLSELGCSAYRISLERSVIENRDGSFNVIAIGKYREFFKALKNADVEPWVTLHHFTNPKWFADAGGFTKEENIEGFVTYAKTMVEMFPNITNWMTFNEPGIRGLEAYVRGEHPPQQKNIATAAQVIRNLLRAHTVAYKAMKESNEDLNIGITHQWLKFLPFSGNPIEKIVAFFFTSLIHTPVFKFFKEGNMHIKIPFRANVQLCYENPTDKKIADFLGVQAYGFPRIKIGLNGGVAHPGAKDKVQNFVLPYLPFGFTTGSTCGPDDSMQYFGPPSKQSDLVDVLEEAFSIPKSKIPAKGITETGADARQMAFGDQGMKIDEDKQAEGYQKIIDVTKKYNLTCLFFWTLNQHCEWISGSLPKLGITKLRNKAEGPGFDYEETPAFLAVQDFFRQIHPLANQDVA